MDNNVKKDIKKRYRDMTERFRGEPEEKEVYFFCGKCGKVTRTRVIDNGVVPMGIECPYCFDEAMATDDAHPELEVTHEWYRPSLEELYSLADGHLFTVSMALTGGLLRRPIKKD